jgi:ABC-type phosphate/phosphonate transport system substrate-binding protein
MMAALPMYDWPEIREATDAWWAGLAGWLRREGLRDVPDRLMRGRPEAAVWEDPALLLSQTCGLPFVRRYRDQLQVVATPCYAAEGCDGPTYSSVILIRAGAGIGSPADLGGKIAACNSEDSLSGHLALRLVLRDGPALGRVLLTGSHAASMVALRDGAADVCAIDCVTWAIASRHRPGLTQSLVPIAWSPAMPALPYVSRGAIPADDLERVRTALALALQDPGLADCRTALVLSGAEVLPDSAYDRVGWVDRTTPLLRVATNRP